MGWSGGLTEWQINDVCYLSVSFTWKIEEAYSRAVFANALGLKVKAGGPALFLPQMKKLLSNVAEIEMDYVDAVARHNPEATFASRGCPVGCWFCIVPKMEGKEFTLIDNFPVRPILCDNNLSALPPEFQEHIIARYKKENVPLLDANSGFEPRTFNEDVYHRWKKINRGPWRFAYDDYAETKYVLPVMEMLKNEPSRRKRVYVLIGNEPFDVCMERINKVIINGCEPHVQPYMKLNALERRPYVRFDWTERKLKDVARWANGFVWRKVPFAGYERNRKNNENEKYDDQQGLFL